MKYSIRMGVVLLQLSPGLYWPPYYQSHALQSTAAQEDYRRIWPPFHTNFFLPSHSSPSSSSSFLSVSLFPSSTPPVHLFASVFRASHRDDTRAGVSFGKLSQAVPLLVEGGGSSDVRRAQMAPGFQPLSNLTLLFVCEAELLGVRLLQRVPQYE